VPWQGKKEAQIIAAIAFKGKRLPIPAACPVPLTELITACWEAEAERRPTFAKIVEVGDPALPSALVTLTSARRPAADARGV